MKFVVEQWDKAKPVAKNVANDLTSLQAIVDGYITIAKRLNAPVIAKSMMPINSRMLSAAHVSDNYSVMPQPDQRS